MLRDLLRLALPALPVLAAEPLYVLFDTALVGHLGAVPLAALAAGGTVLAAVSSQLTFLAYGTTARSARFYGHGQDAEARMEGVQASWLAVFVGCLILAVTQIFLDPITRLLTGGGVLGADTALWLRISLFGVPFILLSMAGNGWMRGVQQVRLPLIFIVVGFGISAILCPGLIYGWGFFPRLGLHGSAIANVVGQSLSGVFFLVALIVTARNHRLSLVPRWSIMRRQLRLGTDLIVRSLGFQVCFLSLSAVAARTGAQALAAHQIVWQLWTFTLLVLDSIAIAAQSLVGAALGHGNAREARDLGKEIVTVGLIVGAGLALVFLLLRPVIPHIFTSDSGVLAMVNTPWWYLVGLLPLAGALFASDGVLLGAGDVAFLRNVTAGAAFFCFLPLIWLSYILHWGLLGLWSGFALFTIVRAISGLTRQHNGKWAVAGVPEQ